MRERMRMVVSSGSGAWSRGIWAGRVAKDPHNPRMDARARGPVDANTLVGGGHAEHRGILDDAAYLKLLEDTAGRIAAQKRRLGTPVGTTGSLAGFLGKGIGITAMDIFMTDPEKLSESDLIKAVGVIRRSLATPTTPASERAAMMSFGKGVQKALRRFADAKNGAAKAILSKDPKARAAEERKDARPSPKAEARQVNARGKVAYTYPKKNGGKAPDKAPAKASPGRGQTSPPSAAPPAPLTPPRLVNPTGLCANLGVTPAQLADFAGKRQREDFIDFFMQQKKLAEQLKLTVPLLGGVYDTLTQPQAHTEAAPPPDAPNPGKMPASGGAPAAKRQTLPPMLGKAFGKGAVAIKADSPTGLLDLLKSRAVRTVSDIHRVVQDFSATDAAASAKMTRSLLKGWEKEGLVTIDRG